MVTTLAYICARLKRHSAVLLYCLYCCTVMNNGVLDVYRSEATVRKLPFGIVRGQSKGFRGKITNGMFEY